MSTKLNDSAFQIRKAWLEKQAEADALRAELMREQMQTEIESFTASLLSNKKIMNTLGELSKKERNIFFKSIINNFDEIFALSDDERNRYKESQKSRKNVSQKLLPPATSDMGKSDSVNANESPSADTSSVKITDTDATPVMNNLSQSAVQTPLQNAYGNTVQSVNE